MGKVPGILIVIVALWAAMEVYNHGTEGAFGGAFASSEDAGDEPPPQSVPQRAGSKVGKAHAEADARRSRLLGETPPSDE